MQKNIDYSYGSILELHKLGHSVEEIEQIHVKRHEDKVNAFKSENAVSIEKVERLLNYLKEHQFFVVFTHEHMQIKNGIKRTIIQFC